MNSNLAPPKGIVMIIDDTPENLALLSDTLSEANYRVLVATDGLSALEQINYLIPDIILLDVMMPGINGYETSNRLKLNPRTEKIPVLFMTALSELNDLLRGFEEGAVDYLVKPIRPPEVLARVETQLQQARNIKRADEALSHSPHSVLAINPKGRITWLSTAATRWFSDFLHSFGLPEATQVGQPLPEPLLEWVIAQLAQPVNQEQTPFESLRSGNHFIVKLAPCLNTPEYLLFMEKRSGQWNLDSVKTALGLTAREAEILMWISRGKTNKEVGLILDSSPRTINKHLEHVFEKLGVATRAAAVSMALQRTANINADYNNEIK